MSKGYVTEYLLMNSNKLGVDIDDLGTKDNGLRVLIAYFNAKHFFPDKEVQIYESAGGHGFHVVVIGVPSMLKVREMLGDCEQRREYSEMRSELKGMVTGDEVVDDVLFEFKCKLKHDNNGRLEIEKTKKRKEISEWNLVRRW